jgi:hypothetical protein
VSIATSSCNELQYFTSIKRKIHFFFGERERKRMSNSEGGRRKKRLLELRSTIQRKAEVLVDK